MTTGTLDSSALPLLRNYKHWEGTDIKYNPGTGNLNWNPYLMDLIRYTLTRTTGEYSSLGFVMEPIVGTIQFDRNLEIKTLNKLLDKARGHSFNLAVASSESKQSIRLVKDTLFSVARAAIDVKNGRISSASERLARAWQRRTSTREGIRDAVARLRSGRVLRPVRSLADASRTWLELQYGWKPLLADVHEAMRAVENIYVRKKPFVTSSVSNRKYNIDIGDPNAYMIPASISETCKMKYRFYEPISNSVASLGLTDPYSVVWEAVPFSFVVDWFIPIGAFLTAANQAPLLHGELLVSKFRKLDSRSQQIALIPQYDGCTVDYTDIHFVRDVFSDAQNYRVPLPDIKALKDSLSPLHIVNAIALLSAQLSSDSRPRTRARL
jgi:hypothetical protein